MLPAATAWPHCEPSGDAKIAFCFALAKVRCCPPSPHPERIACFVHRHTCVIRCHPPGCGFCTDTAPGPRVWVGDDKGFFYGAPCNDSRSSKGMGACHEWQATGRRKAGTCNEGRCYAEVRGPVQCRSGCWLVLAAAERVAA